MVKTVAQVYQRIGSLTVPLLVLHGTADELVPPRASEAVAEKAGSPDVTLKRYDGLYHEILNEPERDEVLGDIRAWLDEAPLNPLRPEHLLHHPPAAARHLQVVVEVLAGVVGGPARRPRDRREFAARVGQLIARLTPRTSTSALRASVAVIQPSRSSSTSCRARQLRGGDRVQRL